MNHENIFLGVITLLIGYFVGSFPSGYLAGKWIANIDLRNFGSGSTGATNVLRHVGKKAALIVFLIDVCKGMIPIIIAKSLNLQDFWQVFAGLFSLTGHIWPIWLKGKGGKAVATGLGLFLGLSWPVGLSCFGVFLGILSFSKIVSLSSIIASVSLPLLMLISFSDGNISYPYLLVAIVSMIMILWRHRANMKRILQGVEPRIGQPR